jgi:Family of unknown function (DUF5681)
MTKRTPLPKTPGADRTRSANDAYPVGYRRPPLHTRFKPGESGNRKGRPPRQRNVRTVLEEMLNQRITVRDGNGTRSLTKLDGVFLTMVNGALKGNPKDLAALITLIRSLGLTGETPEAPKSEPVTADDEAVIADYFQRQSAPSEQRDSPLDSPLDDGDPTGTTPPDKGAKS